MTPPFAAFPPLLRTLRAARGFALLLADYGEETVREQIAAELAGSLPGRHVTLRLTDFASVAEVESALAELACPAFPGESPARLIHLTGFAKWPARSEALRALNRHRDALTVATPCALLFWLSAQDMRDFAEHAPDLWAWRGGVFVFLRVQESRPTAAPTEARFSRQSHATDGLSGGQIRQRIAELRAALAPAQAAAPDFLRARLHAELGELLWHVGEWREARHSLDAAQSIFESGGDAAEAHTMSLEIADIEMAQGDPPAARARVETVLAAARALPDARLEMDALFRLGGILNRQGQPDAALRCFEDHRDLASQLHDQRERAIALGNIARIKVSKGRVDEALKLHKETLQVYRDLGSKRDEAIALGNIARIKISKGQVDEALKLYEEIRLVFEQLGDVRSRAVTLGDIARIKVSKGQVDEALKLREEILLVFEQLGDARSRAVTLGDIAKIHAGRGELDEARRLREEELAVYEQLGDLESLAATLYELARLDLSLHYPAAAFPRLLRSYEINQRIGRLDGIYHVGLLLGQFFAAMGRGDEARAMLEGSRDGFRQLGRADLAALAEQALAGL